MTKAELKERIETLENERFYLNMKDMWTARDYQKDAKLTEEIRKLKKELEKA